MSARFILESVLGRRTDEIINADLDLFFVGEGNRDCFRYNYSEVDKKLDEKFDFVDDYHRFIINEEYIDEKELFDVYKSVKKTIFDRFDYLRIKSSRIGHVAMSEEDLLIDEYDRMMISNMNKDKIEKSLVFHIAELVALWEMNVMEFMLKNECCPLCNSYNNVIMHVKSTIEMLVGGSNISHPHCLFNIIPIIRRDLYQNIFGNITVDEYVYDGKKIINFPKELELYLLPLIREIDKKEIVFVNLDDYYMNEITNVIDDSMELCLLDMEDALVVHNGYQGRFGPIDYLECYVNYIRDLDNMQFLNEDMSDFEVFFVSGRKVIKHNGSYWDVETKEKVL